MAVVAERYGFGDYNFKSLGRHFIELLSQRCNVTKKCAALGFVLESFFEVSVGFQVVEVLHVRLKLVGRLREIGFRYRWDKLPLEYQIAR